MSMELYVFKYYDKNVVAVGIQLLIFVKKARTWITHKMRGTKGCWGK